MLCYGSISFNRCANTITGFSFRFTLKCSRTAILVKLSETVTYIVSPSFSWNLLVSSTTVTWGSEDKYFKILRILIVSNVKPRRAAQNTVTRVALNVMRARVPQQVASWPRSGVRSAKSAECAECGVRRVRLDEELPALGDARAGGRVERRRVPVRRARRAALLLRARTHTHTLYNLPLHLWCNCCYLLPSDTDRLTEII